MGFFSRKRKEHQDIRDLKKLTDQNERDIKRIEHQELKRVKARQAIIRQRLYILQQELDVQTAQGLLKDK